VDLVAAKLALHHEEPAVDAGEVLQDGEAGQELGEDLLAVLRRDGELAQEYASQ
jgi:hypothetical protein